MRSLWLALLLLLFASAVPLRAQDLEEQPTAFTAWINLQADASSQQQALPIWLERFDTEQVRNDAGVIQNTFFRIRFRHFPGLVDNVMLRVYFDDLPGAQPTVSGWNEVGGRTLAPVPLGQGLGLPSSETLRIPMANVDYVEIAVPGAGTNVQGVLALALQKTETEQPTDFAITPALEDPFGNAEPAVTGSNDTILLGRVKATLEPGVIQLAPEDGNNSTVFEFPLASPPLLALVTFEILNTDVANPPDVTVNGTDLGTVSVIMTDLADPAYSGSVETAHPAPVYHYAGWLKAQKIIPGNLLVTGTNQVIIAAPADAAPSAIRSVELQLKYPNDNQ